jgi:Leucine-rich repeat (LRR) protein
LKWNPNLHNVSVSHLGTCINPTEIVASGQKIAIPDVNTFKKYASLKRLTVKSGKWSHLIDGTFSTTKKLVELNLESNFLDIQNVGCFTGLVELKILRLSNNCLVCLPTGLFKGLAQLEKVYLDNNHLQMLDLNMFIGLKHLNVVALHRNFISTINSSKKLVSMKELILHENKLTDVSALKTVQNLTFVNLSDNLKLALDSKTFENCTHLETLSLNNVTLARYENFYDFLNPVKTLKSLSIGKNNLTRINIEKLGLFKNLEKLTIEENNLNLFDYDNFLKVFKNIKRVKIGGNNLKRHKNKTFVYAIGDSVQSRPDKKCIKNCKIPLISDSTYSIWGFVVLISGFAIIMILFFYKYYVQRQNIKRFQQGIVLH